MKKGDKVRNRKTNQIGLIASISSYKDLEALFVKLDDTGKFQIDLATEWEVTEPGLQIPGIDLADGSATIIYELWSHKRTRIYRTMIDFGEARRCDLIATMKSGDHARHVAREHNSSILRALGKKSY